MARLLVFLALAALAAAAPRPFTSGPARTSLLELFTSEGCSSCPPAEAQLAGLREHPGLWRDFVPVAFHVDYWNRLGWADRFARAEFTAREQAYARAWGADTVYTPCFVVDGEDRRNRLDDRALAPAKAVAGRLEASYDAAAATLRVHYAAAGNAAAKEFEVHAAVLGGGITSRVRAGENRGRTLRHEFVALSLGSARLRDGTAELPLPRPSVEGVGRLALAVWVTPAGRLEPVQATGGWLDPE